MNLKTTRAQIKRIHDKSKHKLQVLIHERGTKRHIRKCIQDKLIETNNEVLLTNHIMSYLKGYCNYCGCSVTTLKSSRLTNYKNTCVTCYKKNFLRTTFN